jgi:glucose/arabinose dehydrogenase
MILRKTLAVLTLAIGTASSLAQTTATPQQQTTPRPAAVALPEPFATPSVRNMPRGIGWPEGRTPTAPAGFQVAAFAHDLAGCRWLYILPNGDVLVAQAAAFGGRRGQRPASQITLLRDADRDGRAELREVFLSGLNRPHGMALVGEKLYVGNTDAVVAYPYAAGQTKITAAPERIVALPAGGYNNHWTRGLLLSRDGKTLFVAVGSGSNVAENGLEAERNRANILVMNLDGSNLRVFASGLRNPVGMDFEPVTGMLWTAVNERDELGDELVPDYMTSVKEGGFYGWPFSYFGQHEDPRLAGQRPDLVAQAIVPDVPLGSHTASLGLAFYTGQQFPEKYRGGAFIGQRGSWNRSQFAGYRVAFVPFKEGKPAGPPEDFLTGFIANEPEVFGRPVGVVVAPDGALLVADEIGAVIWRVAYKDQTN